MERAGIVRQTNIEYNWGGFVGLEQFSSDEELQCWHGRC